MRDELRNISDSELKEIWLKREEAGYPGDYLESVRQELVDRDFSFADGEFATHEIDLFRKILKGLKSNSQNFVKATVWTFCLAALYVALHYVPLPAAVPFLKGLGSEKQVWLPWCSILNLGLAPVINAFLCVEIFSLLVRPLNRWRLEGIAGREKLNQCAWIVAVLFVVINAIGTSGLLTSWGVRNPGVPILGNAVLFMLLNVTALAAGTFLGVWIAQLITRFGLGNGFLVLFLVMDGRYGFAYCAKEITHFVKSNPDSHRVFSALLFFALLVLASVFLWRFIRKGPAIPMKSPGGKILRFEVSPVPQSLQIQVWAVYALLMPSDIFRNWELNLKWMTTGWSHITLEILLMAIFGWLFYNWFWGDIGLFGLGVENVQEHVRKREKFLARRFWRAMAVVLAGCVFFWLPLGGDDFGSLRWVIDFAVLAGSLAIIQDLWAQWIFWRDHGRGVEVMEMDNVHLASYLKGLFRVEGVPCHIRAYAYRRLFFIFAPLIKMTLLVPEEFEEKAREILASVRYEVA